MSNRKRPLQNCDLNSSSNPPEKTSKAEPAPRKTSRKTDLQKECIARGLFKTGTKSDLIARLELVDKARKDKYANAKKAPFSKEDTVKCPIGAKVPPSKSRARSGNYPGEKILKRGPTGPPVYDEMGFELYYDKVACSRRGRPGCRTMNFKQYGEFLARERRESDGKTQILGMGKDNVSGSASMAWNDRVSRDLGILYHEVDIEDFEEWHRRGFKAEDGEFKVGNISEEERERLHRLTIGSAFRK
ncbi:hypothetical protein FGG08_004956 [Glutinoglossum americanum]|uniref:SAP domain-containing protein n=1 Tax=Glutinoglossum americanum TaxID=1670608 RepID=A0A9P8HVF9_9PEZI|nr:hypothetical protein FGG08_004956 [Glutinoglossum americanum]